AFHDVPITVADNERLAHELIRRLGLIGSVEIFPRRQRPGTLARDVNMPYFSGQRGYLRPDAKELEELPLAECLAAGVRITAEQRAPLLAAAPGDDDTGRGTLFADYMLERYKAQVATEPVGGRNNLINKAAWYLATMAARGWIGEDRIEDELMAAANTAGW